MIDRDEKLAFLDLETTGLSPYGDRICEIAILTCRGLKIEQEFSSLINPQKPISPGAYAVNGISAEMVKESPVFSDIADNISGLIKDRVVICHNAGFDLEFLRCELARINSKLPQMRIIDTLWLARKFFNFSSNRLSNIAYYLGISSEGSHRALCDVHTMRNILIGFIPALSNKGIKCIEEVFIK